MNMKQMEETIDQIVSSELGAKYNLTSSLRNIPEIPHDAFSELQEDFHSGRAIVRVTPLSQDADTFNIIASPLERHLNNLGFFFVIVSPVTALILCFFISWSFLAILVLGPLAFAVTRRLLGVVIWPIVAATIAYSLPLETSIGFWSFICLVWLASIGGLTIRRTYLHALFHRAMNSEKAFSYLFTRNKITLELPETGIIWREMT